MPLLYHYTTAAKLIEHILPTLTLRTNNLNNITEPAELTAWSFEDFNVPYEQLFAGIHEANADENKQRLGKMVRERFEAICFSGAQGIGWGNEAMWAQVSRNGMGVCLELDEDILINNIKTAISGMTYCLEPVSYQPPEKEPQLLWNVNLNYETNFTNNMNRLYADIALTKSQFWAQEDEKRLLLFNPGSSVSIPIANALKAIYLGLNFNDAYLPAIIFLAAKLEIMKYSVRYVNYRYKVQMINFM